ncbi:hypothetical protein BOTBODRAFT_180758 [Botryobasidium botryosum FD-172 SS1]|uniref:F-box domain-containing protein n=1 Tax=Botryobasidium botryosum (strain FD-172 SS1) TaxID=930990 RepID=A0A067LW20_BOTB1|nr:hypothetical protein BOTBODRAFT_180758 [Botryobasidium botryosum FD-172 SS1]
MDAIILSHLPQLIQSLCHQFRKSDVMPDQENVAQIIQRLARDLAPSYIPDNVDLVKRLYEECEAVKLARNFAIDAIRLYTEQVISALRIRHNEMNPIYRLPNEVLALIFQFTESSRGNTLCPLERRAPLNLLGVSKVWRDVALTTPQLWTKIDAMNASLKSKFMERSLSYPLYIDVLPGREYALSDDEDASELSSRQKEVSKAFDRQRNHFPDFIESLQPHAERWASLRLQGIKMLGSHTLLHFPVPKLEVLHVHTSGLGTEARLAANTPFGGETPSLRDLHLAGIGMPLDWPAYVGLTRLHFERIRYNYSTIQQLIQILAACPLLEALALDSIQFASPPGTAPSQPIHLAHLRHMKLNGLTRGVESYVLRSILFPPFLRVEMTPRVDGVVNIFPPDLRIEDTIPSIGRIRHLTIQDQNQSFLMLGKIADNDDTLLALDFETNGHHASTLSNVLINLSRHVPFAALESITLDGFDERTVGTTPFSYMLLQFPNITSLTLISCSSSLVDVLIISAISLLCRSLETLRLVNMHVSKTTVALVESRIRSNYFYAPGTVTPLRRCILSQCYGEVRGRVPQLRELVELEWY